MFIEHHSHYIPTQFLATLVVLYQTQAYSGPCDLRPLYPVFNNSLHFKTEYQ